MRTISAILLLLTVCYSEGTFTKLSDWNEVCGKGCYTQGVKCKTSHRFWGNLNRCRNFCDRKEKCHGFQSSWTNGLYGWCVWFKYTPVNTGSTAQCHVGEDTYVKDPVDCEVSEWTCPSCSSSCGNGFQTRKRFITTEPMYGGAECPTLTKTVPCNTHSCALASYNQLSQFSEVCDKGCNSPGVHCLQDDHWQGDVHACSNFCDEHPDCKGFQTSLTNGFQGWCVWFDYTPVDNGEGHTCHEHQNTYALASFVGSECEVSDWSEWDACTAECGGGSQTRTRSIVTPPSNGEGECPPLIENRDCNTEGCTVNCEVSEWGEFSDCSVGCDGGLQTRTRTIVIPASNGGEECPALTDSQTCNTEPCIVDCVVSEWGEFGACSGCEGIITRTRTIVTFPSDEGEQCPVLTETQPCSTDDCPIDCEVSDWSEFGACNAECGGGIQTRTRATLTFPNDEGAACPPLIDIRDCNNHICPVNCEVSEWGGFSDCSVECDGGVQTRTRTIVIPASNDGEECPALTDSQACNTEPCIVDCEVSEWGGFSDCSVECGGGLQTRTRTVVIPASIDGEECPALTDSQACNIEPCIVDCEVSEWGEFGACSVGCGGGVQTRTRTIVTAPSDEGEQCPALSENQNCNTHSCPVNCVVSVWGDFSACSVTCGGGVQTRTRSVVTPASDGGDDCPSLTEDQNCNTHNCPVDCVVSEWGDFSACSVTCGGGIQTRTRSVVTPTSDGGAACPALSEDQVCNTDGCPVDCVVSEWGDFGACSADCDGGTQTRTRTIVTPTSNGGSACPALSDSQVCNTEACGCPVPRVRRAWSLLSCADRDQYIRAVAKFHDEHRDDYNKMIGMQGVAVTYMNQNSRFLPWNRAHVLGWENMLRSLGGEFECITVPYWDSEKDSGAESLSPVFSSSTFGAWGGADSRGCVNSGVASGWNTIRGFCVVRLFETTITFTGQPGMTSNVVDHPTYATFRPTLEGAPNAAVHVAIGGTMASFFASEDPLFFVHHCNLDRFYSLWQDYHGYDTIAKTALSETHYSPITGVDEVLLMTYNGLETLPAFGHGYTIRDLWNSADLPITAAGDNNNYIYGDDNVAGILGNPLSGDWSLVTPVVNAPTVACSTERKASPLSNVVPRCSFSEVAISNICQQKVDQEPGISNYDLFNYLAKIECDTLGDVAVTQEWISMMGITTDMLKYTNPCWYQNEL